jgi:4-hydroxy-L-threonine phosphate dehydrogenase PdxA
MKVYVTQGHEQGIGIEVFLKSCMMMSAQELKLVHFLGYKKAVTSTLNSLKLPFKIHEDSIEIAQTSLMVTWLDIVDHSQSFTALQLGMRLAESGGVLFTLPTSKNQFPGFPGHTEYFRSFYHKPELGMFFSSPKLQVLLLSDHVALHQLSELMTEDLIYERLKTALKTLTHWGWPTKRILIAGLNPHAGEAGMIGHEDERISSAMKRLRRELKLDMSGPWPGDTMLLEQNSPQDLLVYVYHDQGLGVFKGLQGFIGSNITLGLPFPRFSPDHGTSFSLFGKNQADYRGCAFSLKEAVHMLKKVSYGKNSSYKGQGSQP